MRFLIAVAALGVVACQAGSRDRAVVYNEAGEVSRAALPMLPALSGAAAVPEGPYPGVAVSALEQTVKNPFDADTAAAVAAGEQLFNAMNCSGCHGNEGKAGIFAPNLTDGAWRYGGSEPDVFNSIYEGRARGMPAWGAMLSEQQIWQLVSYIHSLGGMTGPRLPGVWVAQPQKPQAPQPQNKRQP